MRPQTRMNRMNASRGNAMDNYLKPPGVLTHALAEYLEKRYGFKRALQDDGMLIGAPDLSRNALIPRGLLLLNDDEVCQTLTSLAFNPLEINEIRADLVHYNPEPVKAMEYAIWLLDSMPPNKKRKMNEETARWMKDFFAKLDAEDAPSEHPANLRYQSTQIIRKETPLIPKDAKPEYTETYTLVEYLEKRYDFENERHESGGLILSAPNVQMKALIQRGHKLLNQQEVCEILEAFGFSVAKVEAIRTDLIEYKPGLFKSAEAAIKILETTPHERHPISEEAKRWEEDFFRKLDEEYEKNAVKTTPPGGIIYNYQNLEGIFF